MYIKRMEELVSQVAVTKLRQMGNRFWEQIFA